MGLKWEKSVENVIRSRIAVGKATSKTDTVIQYNAIIVLYPSTHGASDCGSSTKNKNKNINIRILIALADYGTRV
jgi:hypothetical protein